MSLPLVMLNQTLTMGLYMMLGFALFKSGKISREGSKDLASLLLWLVIPAVIINSFCVTFSFEKLKELVLSSFIGILALILAMAVSRAFFSKEPIDNFAAAFSNAGFIGIPLIKESLGDEAVFYLVGFTTALNILQWTYGAAVLRGSKERIRLKSLVLNPIFVGGVIGFAVFVLGLGDKLPAVLSGAIGGVAATNAPLAMIVLGVYLAQTQLESLVTTPRLYKVSLVRLLVIPLLTLLILVLFPMNSSIKLAVLIGAAAPVGANVAVYAQLFDLDYPYACKTVALSTILSIVTLPFITGLSQLII